MFTLELLFSLKNPLKSLGHSLAPYAIEELLGDALGKQSNMKLAMLGPVCLCALICQSDYRFQKEKTH